MASVTRFLRPTAALLARAARRMVHPYGLVPFEELPGSLVIGLAEAYATGVPLDAQAIGFDGIVSGGLSPLLGLLTASPPRDGVTEEELREYLTAREADISETFKAFSSSSNQRLSRPLREWSARAVSRDMGRLEHLLQGRSARDDLVGPAIDPGGDGPLGEIWPWELSGFHSAESLIEAFIDKRRRFSLGRMVRAEALGEADEPRAGDVVVWSTLGTLSATDARNAEELARRLPAGCELVVYATDYDPDGEDLLYEQGIETFSPDTFPDGPPRSTGALLLRIGQHVAHARLGIGPNHSPLSKPTLAELAIAKVRGLPRPKTNTFMPIAVRPERNVEPKDVLAWISAELHEGRSEDVSSRMETRTPPAQPHTDPAGGLDVKPPRLG